MKETFENLIFNQLDLTVYGEDKNAVKKKKETVEKKKEIVEKKKETVEKKKIVDDKCKEGVGNMKVTVQKNSDCKQPKI